MVADRSRQRDRRDGGAESERYEKYLQSLQWQILRQAVLDRALGQCEICGQGAERLEVHHLHYERIYHEWPVDLVALCISCHGTADKIRARKAQLVSAEESYCHSKWGDDWREEIDLVDVQDGFWGWVTRKQEQGDWEWLVDLTAHDVRWRKRHGAWLGVLTLTATRSVHSEEK